MILFNLIVGAMLMFCAGEAYATRKYLTCVLCSIGGLIGLIMAIGIAASAQ